MNNSLLRKNIEFLMKKKNFNMKSLSLAAGLNETAVRDILKRISNPSYNTINKISQILECDYVNLINIDISNSLNLRNDILDIDLFSIAVEKIDRLIEKHKLELNYRTKAKIYLACYQLVNLQKDEDLDLNKIFEVLNISRS